MRARIASICLLPGARSAEREKGRGTLIYDANSFQLQTMRCRPRNLQARRRRWPLRLGLFLIYVLVQYVSSTKTPTSAETTTIVSSSTQWTSAPISTIGFTEEKQETTEEASTVAEEEPRKTERSKTETSSKGHGRAKAENTNVRGLEVAKIKETTKKEITTSPSPRHGRNNTTTVSVECHNSVVT